MTDYLLETLVWAALGFFLIIVAVVGLSYLLPLIGGPLVLWLVAQLLGALGEAQKYEELEERRVKNERFAIGSKGKIGTVLTRAGSKDRKCDSVRRFSSRGSKQGRSTTMENRRI